MKKSNKILSTILYRTSIYFSTPGERVPAMSVADWQMFATEEQPSGVNYFTLLINYIWTIIHMNVLSYIIFQRGVEI